LINTKNIIFLIDMNWIILIEIIDVIEFINVM